MASSGSTVPTVGNLGSTCLTDTTSRDNVASAGHYNNIEITPESIQQEGEGVAVCQFFLMGKCHFGHRCRLSHSNPSLDDWQAVVLDHDTEGQSEEKVGKLKKNKAKTAKPKNTDGGDKEVSKKPRMRTADEVISRILWDTLVDASEFVVGYVDRFLGVLERPFTEFNWEANPCDCDYSAELALPRHRIQYFTYRGQRVWDRNSRTDRVFGSTGQSLAPPFGWKKEVEEQRMQGAEILEPTDKQLPVVSEQESASTEGTHLPDKNNAINVNTPNSTQSASGDTGFLQSHQAAAGDSRPVVEEALNGLQTLTAQVSLTEEKEEKDGKEDREKNCEEWKESWGSDEEKDKERHQHGHLDIDQCPSAPNEKRGLRPPKRRPTHFICFRANTPTILSTFKRLQEETTSLLPSSAPHWKASSTLHVTLCLLVLPGPAEVAAAGDLLRRFAQLDRNPPVAVSFPLKLKHFSGKVLYLNPQPQLLLQQLNSGLQEAYRKEGWLHRDSFNPRYHLTLAKIKGTEADRIFHGVGDLKVGKGFNFGRLPVNNLHLCGMGEDRTGDFYETLCTVSFR